MQPIYEREIYGYVILNAHHQQLLFTKRLTSEILNEVTSSFHSTDYPFRILKVYNDGSLEE